MKQENVIILGAGIAGISAAYRLGEQRISSTVYEKENNYGGLCGSFRIDGFTFDNFGHISFDMETKEWLEDKTDHYIHEPEALNYDRGRWLRHPVQNNLFGLPIEERIEYIEDYVNMRSAVQPQNYGEWLKNAYGSKFAYRYPYKYTRKYWTVEPEQLDVDWIKGRMYEPDLREILRGAMSEKTPGVHYAKNACYPKEGGFQAFLLPMVKKCNIIYNKKVTNVDTDYKIVTFSDGEKIGYQQLISTIPLPELCEIINDIPEEIYQASQKLDYTTGVMVSLGLNKTGVSPALWYYIYDEDIYPARIYAPDWKSPANVPDGCSAIQAEIYYSKYKPLQLPLDKLLEKCIRQMTKLGLFQQENIIVKDIRIAKYANIMFTPTIYAARNIIHDYLRKKNIFYAGRFGEWDYLWAGQSLLSGRKAAEICISK